MGSPELSGSRNDELVTPIHIASVNLRIKILSVLLKENQVRARFDTVDSSAAGMTEESRSVRYKM